MKVPVASFSEERLTDAPFEVVAAHLRAPMNSKALVFIAAQASVSGSAEEVRLAWARRRFLAEEQGLLVARPDAKGTHLLLEGRMKGWGSLVVFGSLRWHTDDLLDRLVHELGLIEEATE